MLSLTLIDRIDHNKNSPNNVIEANSLDEIELHIKYNISIILCYLNLLFLFVIIRVVDTLHKGFTVVDFVGQSRLQKSLDIRRVCDTFLHRIQVVVLVNLAPINAFLQLLFENQIEPNTSRTTIALTERVSDVHLDIFVGNLLKSCFGLWCTILFFFSKAVVY